LHSIGKVVPTRSREDRRVIDSETREHLESRNLLGGTVEGIEWADVIDQLSPAWQSIARAADPIERKRAVLELWREWVASELSKTILYLEHRLRDLNLIRVGGRLAVLYSVQGTGADVVKYYVAGLPVTDADIESSPFTDKEWLQVPERLREFSTSVHNGFRRYETHSQGIEPVEAAFRLSDLEWGIIDDEGLVPEIKLDSSFSFFSSGAAAYLILDLSKPSPETAAALWAGSVKPGYGLQFWDVLDEWIVLGFQR
jgi:hypothetical protein